jgi:hypothetical protein
MIEGGRWRIWGGRDTPDVVNGDVCDANLEINVNKGRKLHAHRGMHGP